AFERGEGVYLYTADGRRYLDFSSGIAVNGLGHCHPHLVAALTAQAAALWHTSNLFAIPHQQRLAERLVAHSFADTMLFSNSGAEAMECGFKMVRRYHDSIGQAERYRIIAFDGAFHGRTLAAIAAGGKAKHLEGFAPNTDGFDHVAFGNLNELRNAIGPETAAILVEPVQGEGGIRAADAEFLRGLRAVADEFGLLLMFDEIQCGMGRTGKLFAHEWAGVTPDIMAIAKALGGGFPVAACLATERAAACMTAGSHGSTFGGNPLAMAVANAVLDVMLADGFLDHVERMGRILRRRLDDLAGKFPAVIEEVRGLGLMIGLQLHAGIDAAAVIGALGGKGLLTVPAAENVIRLLPPLIVEEDHIDDAMAMLDAAFGELSP
ncbi:MAG: aspartate aminotransferase family protein, partial [Proteobacteria bacterium]|nr:aspartate aminotransferase family protein [Pseudomonadota bacterium]